MGLARTLFLWASQSRWLREQLPRRRFARAAVARFLPGEDLDAALGAAARLRAQGIASVLTRLGENVTDAAEAEAVAAHYVAALDRVAALGLDAHLSVKLTQLGLDLGVETAWRNLERVAGVAAERGSMVWLDMEQSRYTDATLELYRRARARWACTGVCLQANLRRTPADLEALLPLGPAIRLVKGAYLEPRSRAYATRRAVDAAYLRLADRLLEARAQGDGAVRIGFGTHDRRLHRRIAERAAERGVPRDGYEIQMLYGILPETQRRLAAAGHRVRVLISYGDAWFAWYMRRLAERPANIFFVLRSLAAR